MTSSHRDERLVRALAALDVGLPADARHPLVGAGRRVSRAGGPRVVPAHGEHVGPTRKRLRKRATFSAAGQAAVIPIGSATIAAATVGCRSSFSRASSAALVSPNSASRHRIEAISRSCSCSAISQSCRLAPRRRVIITPKFGHMAPVPFRRLAPPKPIAYPIYFPVSFAG